MTLSHYPKETNIIDETNSTNTPLSAAGVFTGTWLDVSAYSDVVVAVSTDQDCSYSVEFSPDGTNQDSTLTRYYRTGQINAPHRFTITRKYFRVVLTNGSVDQTYLRLQVHIGSFGDLNAPIDGTLSRDFDAIVVRPTDYFDEVALGQRQGRAAWHKWGYNTDVDTAAIETIWEPGGNPTFLTTASTLTFVSSDANDIDAGTGAHGVVVYGLDENREEAIEVVLLNGTTGVVTTSTWLGVNRVALYRCGSSMFNEGKITVTATTGGSIQATVPAEEGTTQQAIFFTQAGHKTLVTDLMINIIKTSGGSSPQVTIRGYVLSYVSNARYEVFRYIMDVGSENHLKYSPKNRFMVDEQSVLYFTAETDTNNTSVKMRFSAIEVKDADS